MVIYFLCLVSFSVLIFSQLDRVIFCVFLRSDKELYETMLPAYFPRGLSSHTLVGFSCFIGTYRVSFILNTLYTLSPKINPHRELSAFLHLKIDKIHKKGISCFPCGDQKCQVLLFFYHPTYLTHTLIVSSSKYYSLHFCIFNIDLISLRDSRYL